ncbi:MAG TPA: protein kinase [Pyrinomonadaceae bacterium]|nr:protein kinase [Pyrinomonadaceae bacterium]
MDTLTPGTRLGRYEIRSKLGAGGMGEVYLATDTELDRTVAIKILPERLAADPQRLQRFIQEARAASALNHPHIMTIHEIGAYESSRFMAMEFIDGETLRERMRAGMKLLEVLEVASEIAGALVAAHAAGIVHRDVKPDNVMVRRDGYVKVLDFGLAKLTEPKPSASDPEAPTRAMVNTDAGTVMGTANYMSPEQAKGVHVDARSDLWSLGALLYEMTSGHLPFAGETPTETISLILQKEPPPLTRFAPAIPEELDRIVTKALEKDREERYQTAKDLLIDLRHLKRKIEVDAEIDRTLTPEFRAAATQSHAGTTVSGAVASTHVSAARASEKTGSRAAKSRWKVPVIVAAILIVAVAAAAVWVITRRRTPLNEKDTVLIADFGNTTAEPVFDGTLKQALAVQLGQSPYLNIFPDERVNETLRFMGRTPNARVTRDVAKEICERQGIKAMIVGSIANLGSHYVVTLEAINAHEGDSIAREQSEAESKEQVLKALGAAASRLRERLGESLTSVKKYDAPIEQATTSSLEALKAFTQGNELRIQGKQVECIPFYKRAIELDPNFGLAYARLAVTYSNSFQTELAAEYSQKAYDLRDRVSERERYYISEKYCSYVTGDRDEAMRVLQAWEQAYPNDYVPHNNLAIVYAFAGQHETALKEAREALRLNPNSISAFQNTFDCFVRLNRLDEAKATLEQYLGKNPERPLYHYANLELAMLRGDQTAVQTNADWLGKLANDPDASSALAAMAAFYGQWRKSLDLYRRTSELLISQDRKETAAQSDAANAFVASQLGLCDQAKQEAARGLSRSRGRMGLGMAAVALAACNDHQGPALIEEMQKRFPKDTGILGLALPLSRAFMELNRGNTAPAIDATQPAMRFELGIIPGVWLNHIRGQIYLKQKSGKEAAAEFQKIIDHPGVEPMSPFNALAHLGLARASVLTGDTVKARKEFQDFLAIWKDADSDLPVIVEARKEYEQVK